MLCVAFLSLINMFLHYGSSSIHQPPRCQNDECYLADEESWITICLTQKEWSQVYFYFTHLNLNCNMIIDNACPQPLIIQATRMHGTGVKIETKQTMSCKHPNKLETSKWV